METPTSEKIASQMFVKPKIPKTKIKPLKDKEKTMFCLTVLTTLLAIKMAIFPYPFQYIKGGSSACFLHLSEEYLRIPIPAQHHSSQLFL